MPPESPRESVPEDEVEVLRLGVADHVGCEDVCTAPWRDCYCRQAAAKMVAALTAHRAARGWVVVPIDAERVIAATRARFEVWTRETYRELSDALEAYDRAMVRAAVPES